MNAELEALWRTHFGTTPPLGHLLRRNFPDRWIRFHALPKGKRYADTNDEKKIILTRANTLGDELFGEDANIWLMSTRTEVPDNVVNHDSDPRVREHFDLQHSFKSEDILETEDPKYPEVTYARQTQWNHQNFDTVFRWVADEEDYGIIFASMDNGNILAPYDGGFDVMMDSRERATKLRDQYLSWLSAHHGGV